MSITRSLTRPITSPLTRNITAPRRGSLLQQVISSLFGAGEEGGIWDPSDFSTMFQDSAGTTPVTAVEQPVGKILDISGNGNHRTQSTAGSRPTLKQTAGGLYYLEYNGTSSSMATASVDFSGTDKMTVVAGVRKLSDAGAGVFLEQSSDSISVNNGVIGMFLPPAAAATVYFASKGTIRGPVVTATSAAPVGLVLTGSGDISGDSTILRVNGVPGSVSVDQGTGNYGNYPLYFGSRAGTSLFFSGHEYLTIIRGAQNTDAQTELAERLAALRSGVTL